MVDLAERTTTDEVPDGYRMTELGLLPEDWQVVRLADASKLVMGQSPPSHTYNLAARGLPFLQGKAEFGNIHPRPVKWCSDPLKIAPAGSILVSVRAPVGDANVTLSDCCIGRGLAAVVCSSNLDRDFGFFMLRFRKSALEDRGTGSTFQSINKSVLEEFILPLPPLPEQRAIAHVLSTVQRAREATEAVIAATRELKRSLIRHLFLYGPVPVDQVAGVRLKETEIGLVPEGWEIERYDNLVSIVSGQVDPRQVPFSTLPHVAPDHIESGTGRLLPTRTAGELNLISGKYHFAAGDVLYSKIRPYLCKAAIVNFEGTCSADMYVLRPVAHRLARDFLFYLLLTPQFTQQAMSFQDRTGIPKINRQQLGTLLLPVPPIYEQRKIAAAIAAADAKLRVEGAVARQLDDLFRTLLGKLVTGQVRAIDQDE